MVGRKGFAMNLWKHAAKWAAPPIENAVTMGEGGTPLVRSGAIGPALGLKNLCFKNQIIFYIFKVGQESVFL
jgi:hypothetical protein